MDVWGQHGLGVLCCVHAAIGDRPRTAGLAGLLLSGAALAKVSALTLAPAMAVAVARGRRPWSNLAAFVIGAVCLAGPWLVRNWMDYGDPTGIQNIEAVEAARCAGRHPTDLPGIAKGAAIAAATFYLWYGQLAIHLPPWLYAAPGIAAMLAVVGWFRASRRETGSGALDLPTWIALVCLAGAFVFYNARVYSPQGRYMYVGVAFFAVFAARGLLTWLPSRLQSIVVPAVGAFLSAGQMVYLVLVVAPAYGRC